MSIAFTPPAEFGRDTAVRELLRPLAPFLALAGVTEIVVNRPGEVMYEAGANWRRAEVSDLTLSRLLALGRAIATYSDQAIGPHAPLLAAVLPDGQRIQIVVPPAVPADTVSLSIRLPSSEIRTLEAYEREGAFGRFQWSAPTGRARTLPQEDQALLAALIGRDLGAFLKGAVAARRNIAIVGDTGSGKTTLMKTLCQHIATDERLITIEDVREIDLPHHPNRVHLLYTKGGQGIARITAADLLAANLRMRPDRVLLAELRGSEAFDFLKLLSTGHSGAITSFHAESCRLAVERFVLMAGEHTEAAAYTSSDLARLVRLTLDIIVHMKSRVEAGPCGESVRRRYVSEVHFDPAAKLGARADLAPSSGGGEAP